MVLRPAGEVSVTVHEGLPPPLLGSLNAMAKSGPVSDTGERYQEKVWWEGQTEGKTGARPSYLGYTGRGASADDSGGGWRRVTRKTPLVRA